MNYFERFVKENQENYISKWKHYFEIYERHLRSFREMEINLLEIGVNQGGSLKMWKSYFGSKSRIFGIDINPACKELEEDRITIFIGDQCDRDFLEYVVDNVPPLDIIIDDGGHEMNQQIISFEQLFPHLKDYGIYICEDLHTSYWKGWGGRYKSRKTFVEYTKNFIDYMNAWLANDKKLSVNYYTKNLYATHYYPSMIVFEKREMKKPESIESGKKIISDIKFTKYNHKFKKVVGKIKNKFFI